MTKDDADAGTGLELAELTGAQLTLAEKLEIRLADPAQFTMMIADRLANAMTPEDLFNPDGTTDWEAHEGVPMVIGKVWWMPSGMADGLGFYALLEAQPAAGGPKVLITTGATNVVIQLARAIQMEWLDRPVTMRRSPKATAAGYYPHRLVIG